jgi:hypothetical protein
MFTTTDTKRQYVEANLFSQFDSAGRAKGKAPTG